MEYKICQKPITAGHAQPPGRHEARRSLSRLRHTDFVPAAPPVCLSRRRTPSATAAWPPASLPNKSELRGGVRSRAGRISRDTSRTSTTTSHRLLPQSFRAPHASGFPWVCCLATQPHASPEKFCAARSGTSSSKKHAGGGDCCRETRRQRAIIIVLPSPYAGILPR